MTYRKLSYEQLQKQLDDMRVEKEAAVQRVLELKEELEQRKNGADIRVEETNGRTKVSIHATSGASVSNVHVGTDYSPKIAQNPKRWMKVGAWIILSMLFVPFVAGAVLFFL